MRRRRFAVLALGLSLAACGTSNPAATTPQAPTAATPTVSPTPTAVVATVLTATPLASPTAVTAGVATRLVIAAFDIDLPIIALPSVTAPTICRVAAYVTTLHQPGEPGAVWLVAQAYAGTFLAVQEAVLAGRTLVGTEVTVYTGGNYAFAYTVTSVRRHATAGLAEAAQATTPQLWIQTADTSPLTNILVIATLERSGPADPTLSHPIPKPVNCR